MQLKERTILITGGTSGIGRALVEQLAHKNHAVIVIASNREKLSSLSTAYDNVFSYPCCLADRQEVESTIATILERHPDVSVAINSAGIQVQPLLRDPQFSFDSIGKEITVNLTAPIWICSLLINHFLALGFSSAYINLTSALALYPKRSSAVYCATKAGLLNFSRSLSYQLESTSVHVHAAILPLVDTPMSEGRGRSKISAAQAATEIVSGVEKNRDVIYVGKARFMPILSRLSPGLMANLMKRG
ncbi:SDR family oxidoreductase [Billgrantia saliphila]|uniref:SDR family oxidoreductase n=1 Tax=Billgrantia saliphila TaxID=1848458 RepID=UPI0018CC485D|nr:SDR family NAD(P)-dependent oxidoreductase [Halomonas saliphila]